MGTKEGTIVALGSADKSLYIGIEPPLSEDETDKLAELGLIKRDELLHVEPKYTLVYAGASRGLIGKRTLATAKQAIVNIATELSMIRSEEVIVDSAPKSFPRTSQFPF